MAELKTMLSAIQPTNVPHLGNYLGALNNWVRMQSEYRSYFFAVDLHALTIAQDPKLREEHLYNVMAYYLACGLSPDNSTLFVQSHVSEHCELAWVLNCFTQVGELNRMTQFKDKSSKGGSDGINAGLFTYPVLMASDILLYDTHVVPVGEDQKQHIELARNIATRFNNKFGKVFVVPEPMIQSTGARIMDLQEPDSKMSKSSLHQNGVIYLSDTDKQILKKLRSAVTDSRSGVDPESPGSGVRNLAEIIAKIEDREVDEVLDEFSGQGYGVFKNTAAERVISLIAPIRAKAQDYLNDRSELKRLMGCGAKKARSKAHNVMVRVKEALGLLVID